MSERASELSEIELLLEPSPEVRAILWRVTVECFIAVSSRRRGDRFIRMVTHKLASEANLASIIRLNGRRESVEAQHARVEAVAAWRRLLPLLIAALPPE